MRSEENNNIDLLTEQDILQLLESDDLTLETLELIEQYQQAQSSTDAVITTTTCSPSSSTNNSNTTAKNEEDNFSFNVGDKCAITFSYRQEMVLLPSIILSLTETMAQVLILTPVTTDTIPCNEYFSQKTCKNDACPYSHGYTLPLEFIAPFDVLGTEHADTLLAQLQYGKRVWCKEKDSEKVWQLGNIIDQLHGPRWRVRLRDSKNHICVDIEHIMPIKSILSDEDQDDTSKWSESEHSDTTDADSVTQEDDDDIVVSRPRDAFGSWQSHTTGFAAKMMKKMGYIEGQGLGVNGRGRLEPIQAKPYSSGSSLDQRPGLGHQQKKKKISSKRIREKEKKSEEQEVDMFGLMNSLLGNQPEEKTKPALTAQQRLTKSTDTRQANQTKAKLQTKLESAKAEYIHATEALRRNKGTAVESQFRDKLKTAADAYNRLGKQVAEIDSHVKRTKQQRDMYTF